MYEKSKVKWFYCNKLVHDAHECKKKKDGHRKQDTNYYDTFDNYEDSLFLVTLPEIQLGMKHTINVMGKWMVNILTRKRWKTAHTNYALCLRFET